MSETNFKSFLFTTHLASHATIHILCKYRETEWMFSSLEGRRQLADSVDFHRLVIIHLGRDHQFNSLESVQNELAAVVSSLQPTQLPPNTKVFCSFLSFFLLSFLYDFI